MDRSYKECLRWFPFETDFFFYQLELELSISFRDDHSDNQLLYDSLFKKKEKRV